MNEASLKKLPTARALTVEDPILVTQLVPALLVALQHLLRGHLPCIIRDAVPGKRASMVARGVRSKRDRFRVDILPISSRTRQLQLRESARGTATRTSGPYLAGLTRGSLSNPGFKRVIYRADYSCPAPTVHTSPLHWPQG